MIAWTQALLLDGEVAKAEPGRLRYRLLHVAAASHSRGRATARLQASRPWAREYAAVFQRLEALLEPAFPTPAITDAAGNAPRRPAGAGESPKTSTRPHKQHLDNRPRPSHAHHDHRFTHYRTKPPGAITPRAFAARSGLVNLAWSRSRSAGASQGESRGARSARRRRADLRRRPERRDVDRGSRAGRESLPRRCHK
jgi:hypothetical protein